MRCLPSWLKQQFGVQQVMTVSSVYQCYEIMLYVGIFKNELYICMIYVCCESLAPFVTIVFSVSVNRSFFV